MDKLSRRGFLKAAGTLGAGALLAPSTKPAGAAQTAATVQTRPFGNSGRQVSMLSMGGMFDIANNMLLMRQAVSKGVTYWDTADCYQRGSERGIGKYFRKYPQDRQKIFLVSKSDSNSPGGLTKLLERSLDRMNTDYLDLYFVHGISHIGSMTKEVRAWAEKQKARGKIRLIGFSTHANMESCLTGAAKLGWIDGIMMTYNWRLMHSDGMKRAVDACAEAGIGLTAMKTQGGGQIRSGNAAEDRLAGRFLKRGFTGEQAKLMAVWQNPLIASICSQMPNMAVFMANVEACRRHDELGAADLGLMRQLARRTESHYCAGCNDICESALDRSVPIADVMRCLMYRRSYGEPHRARTAFSRIPEKTRRRMAETDYSAAEKECPRNLAIGRLMREAVEKLA